MEQLIKPHLATSQFFLDQYFATKQTLTTYVRGIEEKLTFNCEIRLDFALVLTFHKSEGLTFLKQIVNINFDLGNISYSPFIPFSFGILHVALSRNRTKEDIRKVPLITPLTHIETLTVPSWIPLFLHSWKTNSANTVQSTNEQLMNTTADCNLGEFNPDRILALAHSHVQQLITLYNDLLPCSSRQAILNFIKTLAKPNDSQAKLPPYPNISNTVNKCNVVSQEASIQKEYTTLSY